MLRGVMTAIALQITLRPPNMSYCDIFCRNRIVALLAARFLVARVGGITGEILGAVVELSELTVVLTVAGWPGARL